ncbi:type VI secretion system Vgr family protein [Burkholderia ubonensis]|uniref:type VI secretion system Vgr family protein n=1 Tax=Burkholderia ubonensis TaxID=101571 RepID=UPI0007C80E20|nr:type VI secretion system Vgr family protein [Burkholderia ubonensis]
MFESIHSRTLAVSGSALPTWGGRPVLFARRVSGTEKLGKLYRYTLELSTADDRTLPPWKAKQLVSPPSLIGQEISMTVEFDGRGAFMPSMPGDSGLGNLGAGRRTITGLVAEVACTGEQGPRVFYRFTVRPWLWLATRNRENRVFQNMSVDQITDAVLKDRRYRGFPFELRLAAAGLNGRYPTRDYVRQMWESDYAFLTRLWREWGLYFFMDGSTLVIADSPGAHRAHGNLYDVIRYHAPDGARIDEEHIHRLDVSHALTAGSVHVTDYDYTRPRARLDADVNRPSDTAFADAEHYVYGDYSQPLAGVTGMAGEPNDHEREARHLAGVRVDALRAKALRVTGKGNLRGLSVGHTFHLVAHPDEAVNVEYLVVATRFDLRDVDDTTQSTAEDVHYACVTKFELQPANAFFRNAPRKKPTCGAETAIVVGPEEQPMWVDGYARIKVRFVWDRRNGPDENASCWVRVAQPWQGNGFGFVALPRVGQEVTVLYHESDPDKPFVTARQVNGFNQPPWELPKNQALTGWLSRALTGSQSTAVVSDDTPGKLQVQVASDHAKTRLVVGYNTRIEAGAGRMDARGEGWELATHAWGVARANRGMLLTTETREGAASPVKDMGETITRLTQARDVQESLTALAQRHGAQRRHADQSEVARAITIQNDAIRGVPATPDQPFPEFARADMALSSAEGLAVTAARSVHVAADEHIALTSVGHVAIATGRSVFASVREVFSLFVRKGLRLIAGTGKVEIQAQQNDVEIIAKQVLDLISAAGSIRLTAAKSIELKVDGTAVRLGPDGFQVLTGGKCHWYAGDHQTFGPQPMPVNVPLTEIQDAKVAEHFVLPDNGSGIAMARQRYRITLDDGQVIEGTSTEHGETSLVASKSMQIAKLVLLRDDGTACSIFRPALTRDARAGFVDGEDQG